MKARLLQQVSPATALVAMLVALAPGAASADNFVGTDFQAMATAAAARSTPEFDYAAHGYRKLNLSAIGNTAWVPAESGAYGPLRESMDSTATGRSAVLDQDRRFYPIGGHNTP